MIMEIKYKTPNDNIKEAFNAADGRLRKALESRNIILAYAIALDMKKYFEVFDLHHPVVDVLTKTRGRD